MARSITVLELLTRAKARADLKVDDHITDAEWQVLVASLYNEMRMAVNDTGMRYDETTATITATGAATYALPSDHLSTIGVWFVDSSGRWRPLVETMPQELSLMKGDTGQANYFALTGQNMIFGPVPASGSYAHVYIPQPTDYATAATSTAVDVVNSDGEEFIIEGAVCKALPLSESDRSTHVDDRDAALRRLTDWAIKRSNAPRRLVNPMYSRRMGRPGDWRYGR